MAATASQTSLSGLPRRLVQDGIIAEDSVLEATDAARREKRPLVAYLVANELADSRAIAVAASHEFGVPLLDLDAIEVDLECLRAVRSQKLLSEAPRPAARETRPAPVPRHLGPDQPAGLIDEVKFQPSLEVDPVVVEQAKLEERMAEARWRQSTRRCRGWTTTISISRIWMSPATTMPRTAYARRHRGCAVVRFVNGPGRRDQAGARMSISSRTRDISRPARVSMACCPRSRSRPWRSPNEVVRLKVMSRMDIAERRARRTAASRCDLSKNRAIDFRVQHLPDAVRREDRAAQSRYLRQRKARHRRSSATSRSRKSST
ncbi:MAG: hypothetical protein U5K76_13735 [Woeseiaceae bacterium]|nr:hypothetical protein [Woeseiaceae bacterium]